MEGKEGSRDPFPTSKLSLCLFFVFVFNLLKDNLFERLTKGNCFVDGVQMESE